MMPEPVASPQKRMTRARAAAKTAASDESARTKSTKAAAAKAKASTTATSSRRKTAVTAPAPEPEEVVMVEAEIKVCVPVKAAVKKRGAVRAATMVEEKNETEKATRVTATKGSLRGRKTPAMQDTDAVVVVDTEAPKTRGRPRATAAAAKKDVDEEPTTKTSRGRAKKAIAVATPVEDTAIVVERPTRTRGTATGPTAATRSRAATGTTTKAAPKKKVTFKDVPENDDQENMPMATEVKEKKVAGAGLKAKPVRKSASTRGRKPASRSKIEPQDEESKPLSPKKVTQVAKSNSSVSSDDELSGAKTPVKTLSKSPVKAPTSFMGSIKKSDFVKKLDFTPAMAPNSPTKSAAAPSSFLTGSPARRPPQSPFKDSMKESPKRGVALPEPMSQPSLKASTSPLKASLLQSPARRPVSPQKWVATLASPSKSVPNVPESSKKVEATDSFSAMGVGSPSKTFLVEPDATITTHFRASPERSVKVHRMTEEELAEDPPSPTKIGSPMEGVIMTSRPPILEEEAVAAVFDEDGEDHFDTTVQLLVNPSPVKETGAHPVQEPASERSIRDTALPSPPRAVGNVLQFRHSAARKHRDDDEDSEDELQSDSTPLSRFPLSTKIQTHNTSSTPFQNNNMFNGTFNLNTPATTLAQHSQGLGITPLAAQFSEWLASSPDKNERKQASRGLFSPAFGVVSQPQPKSRLSTGSVLKETPPKSTFFEDEMAVRELEEEVDELQVEEQDEFGHVQENSGAEGREEEAVNTQLSQAPEASEVYGDENEPMPIDPLLLVQHQNPVPVTFSTPLRTEQPALRVVHTVSKVPLKAAAEDSPIKVPKKRSRSLSGPSSPRKAPAPGITRSISTNSISQEPSDEQLEQRPVYQEELAPASPDLNDGTWSAAGSPLKTPNRNANPQVLQGAVVYVDVHTTEGADASGIFVDLLTQMGARCVKQWNWNPRASVSLPRDATFDYDAAIEEAREASTPAGKIGITHVVFKDGGKRTLEKVRDSKGVVLCVGVGWVLDCERENKWLEELDYAVDTTMVPRGGSRRRKSMEPRALSNINGNLVPLDGSLSKQPVASPTSEFLTFASSPNTPKPSDSPSAPSPQQQNVEFETPARPENYAFPMDTPSLNSPNTPYYLSKGAQLVQQTCPPKQTGERLFPVSGRIEDQPDESVRQRLLLARRKSLQWAPKVNSPLGRLD